MHHPRATALAAFATAPAAWRLHRIEGLRATSARMPTRLMATWESRIAASTDAG